VLIPVRVEILLLLNKRLKNYPTSRI